MSNARTILWLLAAIALAAAANVLLSFSGGVDRALVQRTSLLDATAAAVSRLTVERRGEPRTVIERADRWRLVEPCSAGVDEQVVKKLLDALATSEIEDTVGDQDLLRLGRTRSDFGLDEPAVTVRTVAGSVESVVSFGAATPSGGGVYAAVEGEDAVFVVASNVLAAVDVPTSGFRSRALFRVGPEAVLSFDVKRGAGSFMRFVRDGEVWRMTMPGESAASAPKVKALLDAVMGARAVDFVWPVGTPGEQTTVTDSQLATYGLDPENSATVTLKCADGVDRQVSFGKEAGGGLVYALIHNSRAIVTVDGALKDMALPVASDFADDRLFPFDRSLATKLSVADGGVNYLLARDEGGAWRLDAPVAAATDAGGVDKLLDRVFSLRVSDTNATGVAVSVNAETFMVDRGAALGGLRLESLRSREIMNIEPGNLRRIVSTGPEKGAKPTAVVYDRDLRAWKVESSENGGAAAPEAIEAAAGAVNPLRAEWIVKLRVSAADLREYGLETPRWTIAIDQVREDSVRRNVLIGDQAQGGWFATLGAADAVFVLSDETVARLTAPLVGE